MALVVIVGGIDLSVGSMFALLRFLRALSVSMCSNWPVPAVMVVTIAVRPRCSDAVNGLLIGYLRLRAFITTLITLIIYRSAYDLLLVDNSNKIASAFPDFPSWNFIGGGDVFGIPSVAMVYSVVAVVRAHLHDPVAAWLARHRDRRLAPFGLQLAASPSGVTIALCYTAGGGLTAIGALFFAARLGTVGGDVGVGLEVTGADGGGARRHQPRRRQGLGGQALVGTLIVLLITNGRSPRWVCEAASTAWCWRRSCSCRR